MSKFQYIFFACAAFLVACQGSKQVPAPIQVPLQTDHSFGNADKVRTKHLHLDLKVDFKSKTLSGTATHTLDRQGNDSVMILDSRNLFVDEVTLDDGSKTDFRLGVAD